MSSGEPLTIKSDLEPHETVAACAMHAGVIADGAPHEIEFDAAEPNIFALQIALACRSSLAQQGRFQGFGPLAQQALGNLLKPDTAVEAGKNG